MRITYVECHGRNKTRCKTGLAAQSPRELNRYDIEVTVETQYRDEAVIIFDLQL